MNNDQRYCSYLPTKRSPGAGKILVAGASGYIGGRLVPELVGRGYQVRAMVRAGLHGYDEIWPDTEVIEADALNRESLRGAMKDIDTAYYLIHSILQGTSDFSRQEIESAKNFAAVAEQCGVKRIIYLGSLADFSIDISPKMHERLQVDEELNKTSVPVTVIRTSVIIGSGSASFEIVKSLVKSLPIIFMPLWARKNRLQPISVGDVIKYLVCTLELPETADNSYDIGGNEILTYEEMLRTFGEVHGLKKLYFKTPFSSIRLFSYIAGIITTVPAPMTYSLMAGYRNEVLCENEKIDALISFPKLSYREAIVSAMSREEQDNIHTRWSDAYPPAHELAIKLHELEGTPEYCPNYQVTTEKEASALFRTICTIGGKEGWFTNNWMWNLRGIIDKIVLGVGTSRGRKQSGKIKINDVIDLWRIEDLQTDRRLLLRAEMKLPGKAWLEFRIEDNGTTRTLAVQPYFKIYGTYGILYWYLFLPFHGILFNDLIKQIIRRS